MIHLITYGDQKYNNTKIRLYKEATNTGWFDTITLYGKEDIDIDFKKTFSNILNNRRGGGYWIWKPYFIQKKLKEINDNDILIYLDAGCSINKRGENRFREYIKIVNENKIGNISFEMDHIENKWTTKEIFDYFNASNDIKTSGQLVATIIIIRKNELTCKIIKETLNTLYENPLLFTDHYNNNQQKQFIDNRHDQSILSIIRKKYGTIKIKDETWYKNFNSKDIYSPFLATRLRY